MWETLVHGNPDTGPQASNETSNHWPMFHDPKLKALFCNEAEVPAAGRESIELAGLALSLIPRNAAKTAGFTDSMELLYVFDLYPNACDLSKMKVSHG